MSERDFVERLGEELTVAAAQQARRKRGAWRQLPWPRRTFGRTLVLVGAVGLLGAGGAAGYLAVRGEVGGPPSLAFVRISPEQRAAGVEPLTRPVIFAHGRLAYDNRRWQLVAFQTTRGLCIEIDWPDHDRASGCGSPTPRGSRRLDWQAQIAIAKLRRGLVLGAVDPAAATVEVRHGAVRAVHDRGTGISVPLPHAPLVRPQVARARVIHVREPRLLAAMGLKRPFAYWLAELQGSFSGMRAVARDRDGEQIATTGVPYAMNDTSQGVNFRSHVCGGRGYEPNVHPRMVSTLPPPAIRERIAALRRAQRPSDLPPRRLMDQLRRTPFWATLQIDAVRLLRYAPNGDALYLIPVTQRALDITPSAGCLRTLSPHQQEREQLLQRRMRERAKHLLLTVYALKDWGAANVTGFYPEAHRRGRAAYGSIDRQTIGMAPDGVASVELLFRSGARRLSPVVGNVWIVPSSKGARLRPRAVIWRDANGHVLRRLR